jgi:hypothetical protein
MNLSLRDMLAGGVGQRLSKAKYFGDGQVRQTGRLHHGNQTPKTLR